MIRLFAGIGLDPALAAQLEPLASGIPGARWIEPRNMHVTLRFIGEVEEGLALELHDLLAAISVPAFDLTLEGLGTFGSRKPRSLWAGVAREPAMRRLHEKIESAMVHGGCPPEPRRFTPHVTLARLKDAPVSRIQEFIAGNSPFRAGPCRVTCFTLFRSHLSRSGSEYEALADYPLG
jgi:2'-5' RNA ligase